MRKLIFISTVVLISSLFSHFPYTKNLGKERGGETLDRPLSNFILDMLKKKNDDGKAFLATSKGLSVSENLDESLAKIKWTTYRFGSSGASSFTFSQNKDYLWYTTGKDSFVTDVDDFVHVGTGVFVTDDEGESFVRFKQPGITPVQGITYDSATDTTKSLWLACFGQSLQKLDFSKMGDLATLNPDTMHFKTIVPDNNEVDPLKYLNHRVFSVCHSPKNTLWVGTAAGVNYCRDYSKPDEELEWVNFSYPVLVGNFVTEIEAAVKDSGEEILFVAARNSGGINEKSGLMITEDKGQTWRRSLIDKLIYDLYFEDGQLFAATSEGLYQSADYGRNFEKFVFRYYDPFQEEFVQVEDFKVYSFLIQNGKYLVSTKKGLLLSEDKGNSWKINSAYQKTKKETYAYPSPFSPKRNQFSKLQFDLKKASRIKCKIYNFAMEEVRNLSYNKIYSQGDHYLVWDGKDNNGRIVANGVYFYKIEADSYTAWNKIMVFD